MPAQRIFVKIEKHFRLLTPNINLQGINLSGITRKAITDSDILSNFDLMVADASIESGSHIRKDVLYSIVKLYVRVQAFSVSKDVIQKYKLKPSPYARNCRGTNKNHDKINELPNSMLRH